MTAKKSKSLLEEVVSGNGISSLRGGMARVKLNCILQLYYHPPSKNAPTIREHVNAFARHSCFRVWNVNTAFGFPPALNNVRFSVILLHYSLFGLPIGLNWRFLRFIEENDDCYKIVFLQDEYRCWPERSEFINSNGIDCVYTLLEPPYFRDTYWKHTRVSKLIYNLPGYVSKDLLGMAQNFTKPDSERTVDVGYRGRKLPYYMGRGSQEKHLIGVEFKNRAMEVGLRVDIETEEAKRIYGDSWFKFLANCKSVLGVEAGVSVFDIDNVVRPQYAKLVKGHPDLSFPDCPFEEVYEAILAPYEEKIFYRTISPRHFEAAAFRVCQILFEGKYSGVLKPMVHYIPLKKDFSNFGNVVDMFRNASLRQTLTENAYQDLIASGRYSYEGFVQGFDGELLSRGLSSALSRTEAEMMDHLMDKGKFRRFLLTLLAIAREKRFPGRDALKPVLKPLLDHFGIW